MQDQQPFRTIGPTTYLSPIPCVLVGCADASNGIRPNLITVAWTGVVCTRPPMLSISLRKERYSHDIIRQTGEFTVNLVSRQLCRAMDFCGVKSGREVDKFAALGLTAVEAPGLSCAPGLGEAPAFASCKLRQVVELGSHDLFLGEVVQVSVANRYFRPDGSIDESAMQLVSYIHGQYHQTGAALGFFGYSVASPKALERRGFGKGKRR